MKTDYEVIQSLKFYFMMSIYTIANGASEAEVTKSLKEFIKEGEGWHRNDAKVMANYYKVAYECLPGEFLSLMEISTKGDRDQITYIEKGYWPK
jgi:hypothetical protein